MSVYKSPRQKWMIHVDFTNPDGSMTRVRKVSPLQTKRDAEAYERDVRRELLAGTFGKEKPEDRTTIEAYAETYVREQTIGGGLTRTTLKSKRALLANWIIPVIGDRRVDDVKTADFTKLRTAMMEAELSGKTTNNALAIVSSLVKWWHEQHDVTLPPFKVGLVKVSKGKTDFFSKAEVAELIPAAARVGIAAEVLVLLGIDAGLRMSECRALQWSDLDLGPQPRVEVSRSREDGEGEDGEDEETAPKGRKPRTLRLTSRLAAALRRLPRHLHDPHVLLDQDGETLTRRMVHGRFLAVRRAAGITHGTFHTTRHTFCSHLAMAGVPVRAIQEMAGHADIDTTMKYMHLAPGFTDDAIGILERHHGATAGSTDADEVQRTAAPPRLRRVRDCGG